MLKCLQEENAACRGLAERYSMVTLRKQIKKCLNEDADFVLKNQVIQVNDSQRSRLKLLLYGERSVVIIGLSLFLIIIKFIEMDIIVQLLLYTCLCCILYRIYWLLCQRYLVHYFRKWQAKEKAE